MIADTKSVFWKFTEYLLFLFFVTFPFVYYTPFLYSGTSTRALNLVILAALLGIAFALWLFKKGNTVSFIKSPLLLALVVYLGSLTISGIIGLSFSTTFWSVATRMTGIWYLLSLGLVMMTLFVLITDEKRHHRFILAITISTAVYSILDLLSTEGFGVIFPSIFLDAFSFGNSTFAAMYIFGAFILSIYYLLQAERRKWWMYLLPILLIINPNILNKNVWHGDFSGVLAGEAQATSYVIVFSFVTLVGIWLVSRIPGTRRRSLISYSLFGVGLVAAALTSFSLLTPGGYLNEAYLSRSTAARPLIWELSQNAIAERPFFGWGADNFERVFEQNYDNRLLQGDYGNEAWFDRAHNVFIDQLVDNGVIGLALYLLVYLVTILALIYTTLNALEKRDRVFASVLIIYFTLHIAELQTAFDTSISYPILAFMFVSAAVLYHRARAIRQPIRTFTLNRIATSGIAVVLLISFSWSLMVGALPLARAQIANGAIRIVGSAEKRIPYYHVLFGSPVDVHAFLWRTETDFQRGIMQNPKVLEDPKKVESLKKEIVIFENGLREYIKDNPGHFRAYLNLADVLIYQRLFEVDKLAEAQETLDSAIKLVPQSPQSHWMKAVAYVYMRKFDLAREYAEKGLALNPKIVQSQEIADYVERSAKTFPEIDLFFFRQI